MDEIRVGIAGGVRTVVLARPAKRNALTIAMLAELEAAFPPDPGGDERVAVVRAEGPIFCAGIDLTERVATPDGAAASPIERALHAIERYPLPVVAVVQGDAIAGGAELAIHCDLVVASSGARMGMSLAQIGLAAPWPLAVKLLDTAGPALARELLLLGDPVPTTRLAELGCIARAVPPDELEAVTAGIIDRLAANAPLSLRAMKATLVRAMAIREDLPHGDVDAMLAAVRASDDAREGMRARLDRRPAKFTGR